jgi:hypothetical protein
MATTYTVQGGDTLGAIAARFGTTVNAIAAANGIEDPNRIFEGQVLTIEEGASRNGSGSRSSGPVFANDRFSQEPNAEFSFGELQPFIQQCADQYGTDARTMAEIVGQESTFRNLIVHDDGTGHGLIGLDDGGLLSDFEGWTGQRFGRGAGAACIPPEWQIEYLAKTLAEFTREFGSVIMAARAWHTGAGGRFSPEGDFYEQCLANQERAIFG